MLTNLPTNPQEGQRITISQIPLIYLDGHWTLDKEALEPPPIRHRDIVGRDVGIAHPAKVIAVEATGDSLEIDLKNIRRLITDLRKALTDSDDKDSQSFAEVRGALDEAVKNHEDLMGVVENLKQTHQTDAAILKNDIKVSFATLVDNFIPILFDFDARLKQHKEDITNNKSSADENHENLMQRLRDFRESLTEDINEVDALAKKADDQANANKDRLDNYSTRLLALSQEDNDINNAISAINQTLESLGVVDVELDGRIKELNTLLDNQGEQLATHQQKLIALRNKADALQHRVETLKERANSHDDALSGHDQRITANSQSSADNRDSIDQLNISIDHHRHQLDIIKDTIAVNIGALAPSDDRALVPGTPWLPNTQSSDPTRPLPPPDDKHVGKYLYIRDVYGNASVKNICIKRNGNYIESLEEDLYLDTNYCWCRLMCVAKGDWRIVAGVA